MYNKESILFLFSSGQFAIVHRVIEKSTRTEYAAKFHQEEASGVLPERRGQGGHPEGDPHPGGDGARKRHLSASVLRERIPRHTRAGTVSWGHVHTYR